jgi:transposase-like protein
MHNKRTYYTGDEKVYIIRKHLMEKVSISDLCVQHKLQLTVFYRWHKQFFEHGARTFDGVENIKDSSQEEKILALEQKLQTKNEVLSELMEEHLKLKKTLGKSEWSMD